jgi:rhodanese-related sulfurtransferase
LDHFGGDTLTMCGPSLIVHIAMNKDEILKLAQARAEEDNLPYAGALLPSEAHTLLQLVPNAKLVDVRTRAEWDWVGRVPGAVQIEWQTYPGGQSNSNFLAELEAQVGSDAIVMFLCRSGARSHGAAAAAASAGYEMAFNVLEGFEGDKNAQGHRNQLGGWRKAGLPWIQG